MIHDSGTTKTNRSGRCTHDAGSLAVATMDARDDAPLPSSSSSSEEDDDEQEDEKLDPEGVN